jgi:hypothetical protein
LPRVLRRRATTKPDLVIAGALLAHCGLALAAPGLLLPRLTAGDNKLINQTAASGPADRACKTWFNIHEPSDSLIRPAAGYHVVIQEDSRGRVSAVLRLALATAGPVVDRRPGSIQPARLVWASCWWWSARSHCWPARRTPGLAVSSHRSCLLQRLHHDVTVDFMVRPGRRYGGYRASSAGPPRSPWERLPTRRAASIAIEKIERPALKPGSGCGGTLRAHGYVSQRPLTTQLLVDRRALRLRLRQAVTFARRRCLAAGLAPTRDNQA